MNAHRLVGLMALAFAAGCGAEDVEEYPVGDEVPVTEPAAESPGGNVVGTDTVLDPVVPPPPGTNAP